MSGGGCGSRILGSFEGPHGDAGELLDRLSACDSEFIPPELLRGRTRLKGRKEEI